MSRRSTLFAVLASLSLAAAAPAARAQTAQIRLGDRWAMAAEPGLTAPINSPALRFELRRDGGVMAAEELLDRAPLSAKRARRWMDQRCPPGVRAVLLRASSTDRVAAYCDARAPMVVPSVIFARHPDGFLFRIDDRGREPLPAALETLRRRLEGLRTLDEPLPCARRGSIRSDDWRISLPRGYVAYHCGGRSALFVLTPGSSRAAHLDVGWSFAAEAPGEWLRVERLEKATPAHGTFTVELPCERGRGGVRARIRAWAPRPVLASRLRHLASLIRARDGCGAS